MIDYHTGSIWEHLTNNTVDVVYDNYGASGTADLAMPKMKSGGVFLWLRGKGGGKAHHPRKNVTEINYGLCDSSSHADLDALAVLADQGHLQPHVSKWFDLSQIPAAFNESQHGKAVGKIGVQIAPGQREYARTTRSGWYWRAPSGSSLYGYWASGATVHPIGEPRN